MTGNAAIILDFSQKNVRYWVGSELEACLHCEHAHLP